MTSRCWEGDRTMEYFLIIASALIVTALIVAVVICLWRKANSRNKYVISDEIPTSISSKILATEQVQENGIPIPIEQLPATTQIDEKSLFQITDRTVLARISQAIPMAAETAARTVANNANIALKNVELYKMDIPYKDLMKSKEIDGAVRASTRNAKNITKNANLIKVDTDKMSKTTAVANGAANVMNVASLVVGQYYMSEISSKLETMTKSIDKISDFQDREFKSRILSVITLVVICVAQDSIPVIPRIIRLRTILAATPRKNILSSHYRFIPLKYLHHIVTITTIHEQRSLHC